MTGQDVQMSAACSVLTAAEAVDLVASGNVVMVGGFELVGAPLTLLKALTRAEEPEGDDGMALGQSTAMIPAGDDT